MNEREKQAQRLRDAIASADVDGLEQFMAAYSAVAVCEWLIKGMQPDGRRAFLQDLLAKYAAELAASPPQ